MKQLTFLLLTVTLLLSSCSSDDNDSPIATDITTILPGTWNITQLSVDDGIVDTGIPLVGTLNFTVVGKDFDQTIVFNDTNTFTSSGGYTATVTTTILGQTTSQDQVIDDFFGSGNWSSANNILTFTTSTSTSTATIKSSTTDTMVLEIPLSDGVFDLGSSTIGVGGINLSSLTGIVGNAQVTLKKQ